VFHDRPEAGRALADLLERWRGHDAVVLGLPRGGVPVAREVATALDLPLDVLVVRKLGVPYQPELAMGAIGEGGVRVINPAVMAGSHATPDDLAAVEARERAELERRLRRCRAVRDREPLDGRTAIVVDDGLATGATAAAACAVARAHGAVHVVLAAPVASRAALARLSTDADEVVVVAAPEGFQAVGQFYDDFGQTSDDEVCRLLEATTAPLDVDVVIDLADVRLPGHLTVPSDALGVVVFAHGSGSSRHSPRNRHVAHALNRGRLATLLLDLLLPSEERSRPHVFDVDLLATRLSGAVNWVRHQQRLVGLPVFLFRASTGSAAALMMAAHPGADIAAIVSRGGRPDLAADHLDRVHTPCLLVVGGADHDVIALNRAAQQWLPGEAQLAVVAGASHLFEEPGALDEVADLARNWFVTHLPAGRLVESASEG